jgi:5-methyltetrahydropteroyltriglutamate--homocysteine methyltransferase
MGQQAKNEFYKDDEEMAMDFAAAVNAEALDLQKAGADILQLDEPWLRNDPAAAKRYAVKAINRALQGITVPTVVHLCFGYAAVVPGASKPTGYSFLPGLADSIAQQISIEAAQPKLDLGVLKDLAGKKILLGALDLGDGAIETPELVAERIRAGLKYVKPADLIPAPDCGMKYLPRERAFGKLLHNAMRKFLNACWKFPWLSRSRIYGVAWMRPLEVCGPRFSAGRQRSFEIP